LVLLDSLQFFSSCWVLLSVPRFLLLRGQPSPTHLLHYEAYADMWHSLKHYAEMRPSLEPYFPP